MWKEKRGVKKESKGRMGRARSEIALHRKVTFSIA